jgi:2-amino-4-hydroxy-6-hydroxymethyldihydropteridine diphosphokinase
VTRSSQHKGCATQTTLQTCEAILSLGSNQGDRLAWLKRAGLELLALPDTRCVAFSPVYETDPVGVPAEFAAHLFLNCIIVVETRLAPDAFSAAIHAAEERLGRTRGSAPNQPRTIDIDIITFGSLHVASPALTLPHPRACERRFVLQPLADLRPDFVFPGDAKTVSERLNALPPEPRVNRID